MGGYQDGRCERFSGPAFEPRRWKRDFKTVLEDWLQVHALNGVYDMSRSNDKVIDMSVQVPIWDEAQGRAYTISRFSTELKNFLDEKLGGEYVASVVTMGQGLTVTIK